MSSGSKKTGATVHTLNEQTSVISDIVTKGVMASTSAKNSEENEGDKSRRSQSRTRDSVSKHGEHELSKEEEDDYEDQEVYEKKKTRGLKRRRQYSERRPRLVYDYSDVDTDEELYERASRRRRREFVPREYYHRHRREPPRNLDYYGDQYYSDEEDIGSVSDNQSQYSGTSQMSKRTTTSTSSKVKKDDKAEEDKPKPKPFVTAKSGKFADKAKEILDKELGAQKSAPINGDLAALMERLIVTSTDKKKADKLMEEYPPPRNVTSMVVPDMEPGMKARSDVHQVLKTADHYIMQAQEALQSAITAFLPICQLILETGEDNEELNQAGGKALDGLELAAYANNALTRRRREALRHKLKKDVADSIIKAPMGGLTLFAPAKETIKVTTDDIKFANTVLGPDPRTYKHKTRRQDHKQQDHSRYNKEMGFRGGRGQGQGRGHSRGRGANRGYNSNANDNHNQNQNQNYGNKQNGGKSRK